MSRRMKILVIVVALAAVIGVGGLTVYAASGGGADWPSLCGGACGQGCGDRSGCSSGDGELCGASGCGDCDQLCDGSGCAGECARQCDRSCR